MEGIETQLKHRFADLAEEYATELGPQFLIDALCTVMASCVDTYLEDHDQEELLDLIVTDITHKLQFMKEQREKKVDTTKNKVLN